MKIQVIDIPQAYSLILDERMAIGKPAVTGSVIAYQKVIKPQHVFNKSGIDVTMQAQVSDKVAINIENQDKRFLGLVDEQVITMQFNQPIVGEYQFIFNGWVEYGYSQTMFAAWQAGLTAHAPTLEYFADGQWHVLLKEFGYPAGMPRAASVPIKIPQATHKLRIRTNMEVYFDEFALIKAEKSQNMAKIIHKYDLKLQSAQLKQIGFPERKNNQQRVPTYDFTQIKPFWDTRYMQGAYTQLGTITPLLAKTDNALAIIGAGEGIELQYTDDLPILANGYKRYYLLKFVGWAKDMDILTKQGETLEPIPAQGIVSAIARQLNQKYNTRFKAGK